MFKRNYYKVRVVKSLYDAFYIQKGLKEGKNLLPLLFNFGLEYAMKNV